MKIGIFTNAYKPIISGVVNSIVLIRKGLKALGHRVYIFAPDFPDYRDEEAGVFRFNSLNLSTEIDFPVAIPYSYRIFTALNRIDLDVIHTHHPFILGEVGARFSRKFHVPLVFTFHTQYEKYTHYCPPYIPIPQDIVKKMTRQAVLNYTDKCNMIICPSDIILSLLDEYGVTAPIHLLHNAIDLSQFSDKDPSKVREKYNVASNEKVMIYVGRMGQEKNLEFMLEAFKKANAEVPESRLMIVGEGPELENFENYARNLGIGDRVIFTGRVEYNDIPEYYALADAFVMTSTSEVKPLALLEAMASGLPVAALEAPGVSDTVNRGFDGILSPQDVDAYSKNLVEMLQNEELRNRLSEGAHKTSENYSIENTAKKLESLYAGLIRRPKEAKI